MTGSASALIGWWRGIPSGEALAVPVRVPCSGSRRRRMIDYIIAHWIDSFNSKYADKQYSFTRKYVQKVHLRRKSVRI